MRKIYMKTNGKGNMYALYKYYINDKELSSQFHVNFLDFNKIKKKSFKYFWVKIHEKISKYDVVITDFPSDVFNKNALSIFVNHGYGTKKTPSNIELNNKKTIKIYDTIRKKCDYIITLSDRDENYFLRYDSKVTNLYPKYLPLGIPRNDFLFENKNNIQLKYKLKDKYGIPHNSIILYAPTWREGDCNISNSYLEEQLSRFIKKLEKENFVFVYRPHYLNNIISLDFFEKFKNVYILDKEVEEDTQKVLLISDVLITDYSSIFLDFLILNRPIFYWVFDYEKYKETRGLEFNLNDYYEAPGEKLENINEIFNYMKLNKIDEMLHYREESLKKYIKYPDSNASKRIWNLITDHFMA